MEGESNNLSAWLFLAPLIICGFVAPAFGLFFIVREAFRFTRRLVNPRYEYFGEWGTKEISKDKAAAIALEGLPKLAAKDSFTDEMAQEFVVIGLQKSVEFHEQGNYWGVMILSTEFEDRMGRNRKPASEHLGIANTFWDCWWDAIAHNWNHYPAIKAEDWPRLAEELAGNINNNEPITHPLILKPSSKP